MLRASTLIALIATFLLGCATASSLVHYAAANPSVPGESGYSECVAIKTVVDNDDGKAPSGVILSATPVPAGWTVVGGTVVGKFGVQRGYNTPAMIVCR